jgi:hypothetical protein
MAFCAANFKSFTKDHTLETNLKNISIQHVVICGSQINPMTWESPLCMGTSRSGGTEQSTNQWAEIRKYFFRDRTTLDVRNDS